MKKYKIFVNGNEYEVEVEELGGSAAAPLASAPKAQEAAPAPKAAPKAAQSQAAAGSTLVEAPLPGKVLEVEVAPGDEVADGQTLLILEAMKMENEIVAPRAGIIDVVAVEVGTAVDSGDLLVSLK